MKIAAAVLEGPNLPLVAEEVELTSGLDPLGVLVRVVATGLCHTDLAVRAGHMPSNFPVIIGHEGAGFVEKVGTAVRKVKPGDRVVLAPRSCLKCRTASRAIPPIARLEWRSICREQGRTAVTLITVRINRR